MKSIIADGADVGYLPQVLAAAGDQTISGFIDRSLGNLRQIEQRLRALEQAMAGAPDDLDTLLADYGALSEEFERRGGYDVGHRMAAVLAGLGVDHLDNGRAMTTLSGGEKARVGLAALLLPRARSTLAR